MCSLQVVSSVPSSAPAHAAASWFASGWSGDREGTPASGADTAPGLRDDARVVLFADDNADARELYAYYLAQQGDRVVVAADGIEALRKVEQARPDIILMDLSMPGIDGWELTRMLKAADHTAGIPIVVLTAHSHAADRARAYDAGCDAFLVKPVSPRTLSRTIADHLDGSREH